MPGGKIMANVETVQITGLMADIAERLGLIPKEEDTSVRVSVKCFRDMQRCSQTIQESCGFAREVYSDVVYKLHFVENIDLWITHITGADAISSGYTVLGMKVNGQVTRVFKSGKASKIIIFVK